MITRSQPCACLFARCVCMCVCAYVVFNNCVEQTDIKCTSCCNINNNNYNRFTAQIAWTKTKLTSSANTNNFRTCYGYGTHNFDKNLNKLHIKHGIYYLISLFLSPLLSSFSGLRSTLIATNFLSQLCSHFATFLGL